MVRRGAKLLHAFAEAVVPRVTLVTRKSYGGAYIAMNSRSLGATAVFAWPGAEVAVMGAKAAVGILHRKKLAAAPPGEREALHAQLAEEHERIAGGVNRALQIGVVDEVVEPRAHQAPAGGRAGAGARRAAARTATSRCSRLAGPADGRHLGAAARTGSDSGVCRGLGPGDADDAGGEQHQPGELAGVPAQPGCRRSP